MGWGYREAVSEVGGTCGGPHAMPRLYIWFGVSPGSYIFITSSAAPVLQGAAKLIACTCLKNGVDEGYPCPDMRANDQGVVTCRQPQP